MTINIQLRKLNLKKKYMIIKNKNLLSKNKMLINKKKGMASKLIFWKEKNIKKTARKVTFVYLASI